MSDGMSNTYEPRYNSIEDARDDVGRFIRDLSKYTDRKIPGIPLDYRDGYLTRLLIIRAQLRRSNLKEGQEGLSTLVDETERRLRELPESQLL
tara:strand:+ start:2795 stop:3073 length:279 start_codon:yes stop_codon:yes gene_type:complete